MAMGLLAAAFFLIVAVGAFHREPLGKRPHLKSADGGFSLFVRTELPVYYDSLIAKLIAWGRDRPEAIARMSRALEELRIDGLTTSVGFHRTVMDNPDFIAGDLSTAFIDEWPELLAPEADEWLNEIAVVAAAVAHFRHIEASSARAMESQGGGVARSAWKWHGRTGGWRS